MQLLLGAEDDIVEAIRRIDRCRVDGIRLPICGTIRKHFPSLTSEELSDCWFSALTALTKLAREEELTENTKPDQLLYVIMRRRVIDVLRILDRRSSRIEILMGDGVEQIPCTRRRKGDPLVWEELLIATVEAARRLIAALVAQENPEHVVTVHRFADFNGIRLMQMELVDGPDLQWLLNRARVELLESRVREYLWRQTLNVVLRLDPSRPMPRMQPGVAVTVIRHCLRGLAALHKQGLVHGDIKLSNIMVRTTGMAKIIDFGSSFHQDYPPQERAITWAYAAPETIHRFECTPLSDLASLGYVLVELLSGVRLFSGLTSVTELWEAKVTLADRLTSILPSPINEADGLVNFCRKLVAANPANRFPSAEVADLDPQCGASHFLRDLVCGNLDCVYEKPLGQWVEAMRLAFQYLPTEDRLEDRSLITNSTWQPT